MIRARFTWALALVLCAGLWACGDTGGGGDGNGGTGGGNGGTGGGEPAVCGNDDIEAGEECDDGNVVDGDGCDAQCNRENTLPGACDEKVDYRGNAVLNQGARLLVWDIDRTKPGQLTGTCGGAGQETVFSFMTERKGLLLWQVYAADLSGPIEGVSSYALTACDVETELACVPDSDVAQIVVEQPGEILLVVDAASTIDSNLEFNLITLFLPLKEVGESCDPTGEADMCVPGYICKGTPATCQEGTAPVLTRGATYFGEDPSYFIAEGTDEENDIVGFNLEPIGADGEPMTIIDTDGDNTPDASRAYLPDAVLKDIYGPNVGFVATGPGEFFLIVPTYHTAVGLEIWDPAEPVVELRVTVVDSTDLESAPLTFGPPLTADEGEACDNDGFMVCGEGLLCKGDPSTCQPGVAPQFVNVLYGTMPDGSGVLIYEGTDPDDDLEVVRLELLDAEGNAVPFDYDGNPTTAPTASIDLSDETDGDGTFYSGWLIDEEQLAAGASIAVTPIDGLGLEGARVVAPKVVVPVRAAGEGCSTLGFDVCAEGYECMGEPATCMTLEEYRGQLCEAAPEIDGSAPGSYSVTGTTTMPSLWDAPAGCGAPYPDPTDAAEGIAILHLPNGAAKVVISTDNQVTIDGGITAADTMVYVIAGACSTAVPLACNDDGSAANYTSKLELTNPAAGDYTIVVDSWDGASGTFQLDVTVQ